MKAPSGGPAYGEASNEFDLREVFQAIRREVEEARSRPALTELYKRAGYLITLSLTPAWQSRFDGTASLLRSVCQEEFQLTAQSINRRAEKIGVRPDYDETWGPPERRSDRRGTE